MAETQETPEGADAADQYGTIPPPRAPVPTSPPSPAHDTKTDDLYATMAREIPAGASLASMPADGAAAAGLPFDRVGEYDILGKIGHGGMGLVLKARQRGLKRIVALKMIKVGQLAEETEIARFLVEARAAAHLKHPNIVAVYDVGEHAGSPFFSMEYVEGQSLHKLISERPLQPQRAALIIQKLALAVDYAHEAGILHRDLKPQNILLDKYEEPKITDFGLATSAQENSQLTATGTVLGTPSYMPPEQARGKHEEMGKWSDVYSLGATLYEALVGRPPFTAATLGETLQQVMSVDPVSPRSLNPAIPRDIETICLKCLEKSPARRYQTGRELADELQRFLEDRPILARPTSRTEKLVRWCRRNPVIAGAIAAVSVAAVFAIISLWIGRNQALEGERKATAALQEADETAEHAMHMVDQLLVRISAETLLDQPGMQPLKADIYDKALRSYEELLPKLEKNQRLPKDIAKVRFQMGFVKVQLGDSSEGERLMESADKTLEQLREMNAEDVKLLTDLSLIKTQLGALKYKQKQMPVAADMFRAALAIRRELLSLSSEKIDVGQLVANSEMNLGMIEEELAHPDKALEHYQAAQHRRCELLKEQPGNMGLVRDQAKGLSNLGMLSLRQHLLKEAESHFEQARLEFASLANRTDRQLDDLHDLGICWVRLGDVAAMQEHDSGLKAAEERYLIGQKELEALVIANSTVHAYRGTLAKARLNLAQVYERRRMAHEAFGVLSTAMDDFLLLRTKDGVYQRYAAKTFFEMLRLQKWKKLNSDDESVLESWREFATKDVGPAWVSTVEKDAAAASEIPPQLTLEDADLASK